RSPGSRRVPNGRTVGRAETGWSGGAAGCGVRLLAESGRRLRICRGLPGFGPVEQHTEVADHVRLYDGGSGWAGRARSLDSSCGGARRSAFGGADAALRRGGGRAAAAPLAVGALLL